MMIVKMKSTTSEPHIGHEDTRTSQPTRKKWQFLKLRLRGSETVEEINLEHRMKRILEF